MNFHQFKKLIEDNSRLQAPLKAAKKKQAERPSHAVMTFGRFQGITGGGDEEGTSGGHEGIINHVKSLAQKHGADHFVFASMSGPDHKVRAMREKNPLHHKEKVGLMRKMFPGTNIHPHQSPYHALEHLGGQGYRRVTMVTGPDPGNQSAADFRKGIAAHGKKFNIKVDFSGPSERVRGRGGVELKGSTQRQLAKGPYSKFAKTLPSGATEEHGRALYAALRRPIAEPKKPKKKRVRESIEFILSLMESRPRTAKEKTSAYYKKEYRDHQSSPKAIKERGQRWTARRRAAVNAAKRKLGAKAKNRTRDQLIKVGQGLLKGKDVDHKKALSQGGSNGNGNTRVVSRAYNRSRNNNIKEANIDATEYLTKRLERKDPSSRPNPEPKTKRNSLSGLSNLPKV